jgi:trk system potassium uptake protein TrkA
MSLEDDRYIVKVEIKDNLHGSRFHSICEYNKEINVILHKRGKEMHYHIDPNLILQRGDILVVEGHLEHLRRLSNRFK